MAFPTDMDFDALDDYYPPSCRNYYTESSDEQQLQDDEDDEGEESGDMQLLQAAPNPSLSFGVEIEAVLQPKDSSFVDTKEYYRYLAETISERYKLETTWYRGQGTRKNTAYDKWHVTYDGSLKFRAGSNESIDYFPTQSSLEVFLADRW